MTTVMARETLLEKKYLHFCYYFAIIPLCSHSTMLETECAITRLVCTPLVCSRCHHNCKYGDGTLMFCRGRHGIVIKCVLHVQHAYFSSFR